MSGTVFATETSVELAEAYIAGTDSTAADRLYHKHRETTLRLAAKGMSDRLQVRVDPEDVYQSVSLILFHGLRHGQFRLTQAGDLRALLAQLTRRRIQKKVEQNQAAIRQLDRETQVVDDNTAHAAEPDFGQDLDDREEIDLLISQIVSPRHQDVIRLALNGMAIGEIANCCGYSAARVRQILRNVAELMLASDS